MCACESLYLQYNSTQPTIMDRNGEYGGNHISVTAARRTDRPATSSDADNNND